MLKVGWVLICTRNYTKHFTGCSDLQKCIHSDAVVNVAIIRRLSNSYCKPWVEASLGQSETEGMKHQ